MKNIQMFRNFNFRVGERVWIKFYANETYHRVTEAAAKAIIEAGAGKIADEHSQS